MTLKKDLVVASAVPLVLSLLDNEESCGYAIIKRVKALSEGGLEGIGGPEGAVDHGVRDSRPFLDPGLGGLNV